MLQSFYARAQYSLSPKHKFYDAKAVEIVQRIDYDFSRAEKDRTMGSGVLARTIVFDELGELGRGFHRVTDDDILRGMAAIRPACRMFAKLPMAKKLAQKILVFERDNR